MEFGKNDLIEGSKPSIKLNTDIDAVSIMYFIDLHCIYNPFLSNITYVKMTVLLKLNVKAINEIKNPKVFQSELLP